MPGPTTRDQILQVAQDLFTTKGFPNASVSDICEQAGVSPPTLYYHFGNKDGLFEAVVEEALNLDNFHDLLCKALAPLEGPWERLRAYVHTYLACFPDHLLNPGLHLQRSTELNTASLRQLGPGIADIHQLTKDLLEAGIASGEFRALDADTVAACLIGMIDSFVRARVYLGVAYDPGQIEQCVVDLLSHGIEA